MDNYKSGYVAIIGRPNVGKSTILNTILGEKICAVSDKPNTTRNKILGIHSESNAQIVFLDTPGIHISRDKINKFMVNEAFSVFGDADVICLVVEAGNEIETHSETIIKHLKNYKGKSILVINKIDKADQEKIYNTEKVFTDAFNFTDVIKISALDTSNIDSFIKSVINLLSYGHPFFPDDILTSSTERFICQEMILEKIFNFTGQEIPYSSAVEITKFKEEENIIHISAVINVERDSQKGIIIGKNGVMIKKIGTEARKEIENFLKIKIFLELNVKLQKNWTKDDIQLKRFGYSR